MKFLLGGFKNVSEDMGKCHKLLSEESEKGQFLKTWLIESLGRNHFEL